MRRPAATLGGDKRRPGRNSEDERRIEELQEKLPHLQALLDELRYAKQPVQRTVQQVKQAGTRLDRALVLETRLGLLENRQVREVEWTISEYSSLLENCPKGQCIMSPTFSAAGIANMQLIFYPNGNKDASDGFCSISLRIPEGAQLSRVLYINHDAFGPNIVKQAVEGYTNACRVIKPSSALRGTAADILVLGVKEIYQYGWASDPMLEKVLLIGDAPAAEINFQLLRELRDREAQQERQRKLEVETRRQEEERQRQEAAADLEREEAAREAAALQEVVNVMPEPVVAEEVLMQGAVKAAQARAEKAAKLESPEERAEREKKEQALAWVLDYQRRQAEEKEEAERQRLEREQAENEVKREAEEKQNAAEQKELEEKQRRAQEEQIERRTRELGEQRRREEEERRRVAEEERRLDEELRRAEEEASRLEEQRLREAEERRKRLEDESRRLEAERRQQEEQKRKEAERARSRQEELRRLEEQRRAFERAEEERLKAEAKRQKEAEEAKQRAEEEERKEEERRRLAEEEVAIGSGFSATRALRRNRDDSTSSSLGGYAPRSTKDSKSSAKGTKGGRLPEPSSEDEETFSMAKFQPVRANMGPTSGSNLRAWALAAAKDESDEEESDEEMDWIARRRELKTGLAPVSPVPASLPSMQAQSAALDDGSESGSDVEPVFFRR